VASGWGHLVSIPSHFLFPNYECFIYNPFLVHYLQSESRPSRSLSFCPFAHSVLHPGHGYGFCLLVQFLLSHASLLATVTISVLQTQYSHSRPAVSSPLASPASSSSSARPHPKRMGSFPPSHPLRPFPSISHRHPSLEGPKKSTKLIEPPKNHKQTFVLNLTQAELGRQ
jgi:hypothetical protein